MVWGAITGSVMPYAAILLWNWWPVIVSSVLLCFLTYKAAETGTIKKRFCLS
jgi:hypothetical protein